jgi:putative copper resistance protein D
VVLLGYAVGAVAVAASGLAALSPATATTVAEVVGQFTATVAGAVCLGGLVLILITARPDDRGVIDPAAFRAHRVVERMSVVWMVTALVMIFVQVAVDAGLSLPMLFSGNRILRKPQHRGTVVGVGETRRLVPRRERGGGGRERESFDLFGFSGP